MTEAYLPIAIEVLTAVVSALVYSTVWYARRREQGEPLQPAKMVATLIVGAAIGVSMILVGEPLRELSLEQKLVAYAGVISLVQGVVKTANERFGLWKPRADAVEGDA